jgi:prophage regulatory protein
MKATPDQAKLQHQTLPHQHIDRFIRLPEVKKITGLCRTHVYSLSKRGNFPRAVRLGGRAIGWVESEISAWVAERKTSARVGTQGQEAGTP